MGRTPRRHCAKTGAVAETVASASGSGPTFPTRSRARCSKARIAGRRTRDVVDRIALLDLGLEENLDTGMIGRFFNAVDDGGEPLVKRKVGIIALSEQERRTRKQPYREVHYPSTVRSLEPAGVRIESD